MSTGLISYNLQTSYFTVPIKPKLFFCIEKTRDRQLEPDGGVLCGLETACDVMVLLNI